MTARLDSRPMICRPCPITLLPVCLLAIGACSAGDGTAGGVTIDTLANGTVLVSNSPQGIWASGEAWHAVEQTRIGSADGTDTTKAFGQVGYVTLDDLGRIYVLDQQARAVRVFEWTGEYVRTLGRPGGGPGELAMPLGLGWGPDGNLWIVDPRNTRYTVYDTAGGYVVSRPREVGGFGVGWGGGFGRAGNLYEPTYYTDRTSGRARSVYVRHTVGPEIVARDSFDLPVYGSDDSYRLDLPDGGRMFVSIPFVTGMTWRFDGVEGIWFSDGETYRLYHRTLGGDTTRIVEREYEPVPVTPEDLEAVRERYDRFGEQNVSRLIERIPNVKPAFTSFVVDDQGYLWVFRTMPSGADSGGATLDVFDPLGRYLGALVADVSIRPRPAIMGDRLVGVSFDDLGVAYVVAYRIEGR